MTKKQMIVSLIKRRDFLAARTKLHPNFTYDKAELSALSWAIELLMNFFPEIVIKREEDLQDDNRGNRPEDI